MFELTICNHGTPALEIRDASPELHSYLRSVVNASFMDDPDYIIRTKAGAFFQGGYNLEQGWVLIEFWNRKYAQEFIDYINENSPVKS